MSLKTLNNNIINIKNIQTSKKYYDSLLDKIEYETFKSRMEKFPIKVDLLNRFRTTKDKNRIIKELKLGDIDIVIGTHKLLGKDVEFKDLGLLIIDEEHRFGVKAKEKIKI